MKTFFKFILALTLFFRFNSSAESGIQNDGMNQAGKSSAPMLVNPLYELIAGNIQYSSSSSSSLNAITFDIFIHHTNLYESGPFEFSAGEYYFDFNPAIANGGTLTYSIIPNSTEFTNPDAIPVDPTIVNKQLRLHRNVVLGAGNGPIISPTYPGTKVVKVKLETTAPTIDLLQLRLAWRDSSVHDGDPITRTFAYIDGASTEITNNGTLIISDIPLPVELLNFTSFINKNNVVLNWSTLSETNNSGFEIERTSAANESWSGIGYIKGKGTTSSQNDYLFEDKNLNSGTFRYRLKQIDYNGNYEFYELNNEVVIGTPDKFSLSQNYPNPFNPTTKIDYSLPKDGFASITVFDNAGREVSKLVNEFKTSGYYTINFNGSSLSSGIYFYKLEVKGLDNFVQVKKMMLIK